MIGSARGPTQTCNASACVGPGGLGRNKLKTNTTIDVITKPIYICEGLNTMGTYWMAINDIFEDDKDSFHVTRNGMTFVYMPFKRSNLLKSSLISCAFEFAHLCTWIGRQDLWSWHQLRESFDVGSSGLAGMCIGSEAWPWVDQSVIWQRNKYGFFGEMNRWFGHDTMLIIAESNESLTPNFGDAYLKLIFSTDHIKRLLKA